MKLSELPKDQLEIGLGLISATGKSGKITSIDKDTREDWTIWIKWEDGSDSGVWHFQGDYVEVIDNKTNTLKG